MSSNFENLKIGDVLVCGWGYSMVLYDFYQVVGKTAKTVKVRELKKSSETGRGFLHYIVKPIKNEFSSDVLTRRPTKNGYIHGKYDTQYMRLDEFYDQNECYEEDHAD